MGRCAVDWPGRRMVVEQAHGGDGQDFRHIAADVGQAMGLGRAEVPESPAPRGYWRPSMV